MKTKLGHFIPYIVFDKYTIRGWVGKKFSELSKESEKARTAIKKAAGYNFDNTHFYVTDLYGHLALKIQFNKNGINIWNAVDDKGIDILFGSSFTREDYLKINEWISNIEQGLTYCAECKSWEARTNLTN